VRKEWLDIPRALLPWHLLRLPVISRHARTASYKNWPDYMNLDVSRAELFAEHRWQKSFRWLRKNAPVH
jgi:hypothetical protein